VKLFAEFGAAEDALRALEALRARGNRQIETYAPFPLTDEDAHGRRGWFGLAAVAFAAGALGLVISYGVQWYANARSYALNIGGRPAHAAPAFVPATFETICLFAAVALFAGLLVAERLPQLWQPVFEIDGFERASIDRFWVVLDLGESRSLAELAISDITPMHPLRMIIGEGGS
jgi:hypothetical protein